MMKKTIFVLGAGNGCGNRVAEKFGKNDFRVVLMARNMKLATKATMLLSEPAMVTALPLVLSLNDLGIAHVN